MNRKILLTSFTTWLPHQKSNASDDLLQEVGNLDALSLSLSFLRQLPVDVAQASDRVFAKINELQPDAIICCGMAESRTQLSVESCAACGTTLLKTSVNLEKLLTGSVATEISDDAGKFVCEGLYYSVLDYLQERQINSRCIFVHVPILTPENSSGIMADFLCILKNLALS
ncbi:peptidase C15 [Trichocoleus sp. DQ-A3]|uniref:pyroglutamyl-peptidase I family protein n=1 Tax=Cyanophyceae TaxID=3028117 RepID=UPI00168865BB|nr:peptidase C15 [Coleofasciculus sp. FACHB-125]MBD1899522.1 peptidase C15 [Coleofasciculus sp. FACHB-125]